MSKTQSEQRLRRTALAAASWLAFVALLLALPREQRGTFIQSAVTLVVIAAARWGARDGTLMGVIGCAICLGLFKAGLYDIATPDGSASVFIGALMLIPAGACVGFLGERVRAQFARGKESEERYAIAARGANDGLWDWDLRTDRVYYSDRWREILGYRPEEVTETPEDWLDRIHPEDVTSVRDQVQAHLRGETPRYENEHRIRRHDGSWTWVLTRGIMTRDAKGKPRRMAGWLTDISLRKHNEQRLRHYAFHDALTGLPNRALFMDRVQHAILRATRPKARPFAVLMLDLDRFKNVNDSLGHLAGDELVIQVGLRIQGCIREGDTVARLGGDEFTVLLEDLDDESDAERVADHIQRSLSAPVVLDGHEVVASASIGIARSDASMTDAVSLLRAADQAMYAAKKQGKGRQLVFDPSLHTETRQRLSLESALRTALSSGQLRVFLQPIVELERCEVVGFEALVRWQHPTLGLLGPGEFIPLAQEAGLAADVGQWVLEEAARCTMRLSEQFRPERPFSLAVNLSVVELRDDNLAVRVQRALRSTGLAPSCLVLEVTESALMDDSSIGQAAFHKLRELGIRVHMDDFGTGYSSLSYLHRFELDALKVDGSFIGKLHESEGAEEIVRTVLTIARDLRLSVIAEGVERPAQLERLRSLGCQAAQGYLFAPPLPFADIEALLRRGTRIEPVTERSASVSSHERAGSQ